MTILPFTITLTIFLSSARNTNLWTRSFALSNPNGSVALWPKINNVLGKLSWYHDDYTHVNNDNKGNIFFMHCWRKERLCDTKNPFNSSIMFAWLIYFLRRMKVYVYEPRLKKYHPSPYLVWVFRNLLEWFMSNLWYYRFTWLKRMTV